MGDEWIAENLFHEADFPGKKFLQQGKTCVFSMVPDAEKEITICLQYPTSGQSNGSVSSEGTKAVLLIYENYPSNMKPPCHPCSGYGAETLSRQQETFIGSGRCGELV